MKVAAVREKMLIKAANKDQTPYTVSVNLELQLNFFVMRFYIFTTSCEIHSFIYTFFIPFYIVNFKMWLHSTKNACSSKHFGHWMLEVNMPQ